VRELDQSSFRDLKVFFKKVRDNVGVGSFRTKPKDQNSDTYPIDINRKTVRAGTVFSDSDGRAYVVYKVGADGTVRLLGSNVNGSLSVQRFGEKFGKGNRARGVGFRNWRPYQLENDGRVLRQPNFALADFSADSQDQPIYSDGSYYKWVKKRLFGGGQEKAVVEFEERLARICVDIGERVAAVDETTYHGMHMMDHPAQLPENIFATDGDWNSYSTAIRDAKLKSALREAYSFVIETLANFQAGSRQYDFAGIVSKKDLVTQYSAVWSRLASSNLCRYSYKSSTGNARSIDIKYVVEKVFDFSFDPYHCPELRWGVTAEQAEFNVAVCSKEKNLDWYEKEKTLRNAVDSDLRESTPIGWGPSEARDVNIGELLERLSLSLAEK
jgi:hypothetical protein